MLFRSGILLCCFVHLHNGAVDLVDADRLFLRRRADFPDDVGDPLHRADNVFQALAGLCHQCAAVGERRVDGGLGNRPGPLAVRDAVICP